MCCSSFSMNVTDIDILFMDLPSCIALWRLSMCLSASQTELELSSVLKCHSADGLCLFKVSFHHMIAYDFEAVNECEDTSQPLCRSPHLEPFQLASDSFSFIPVRFALERQFVWLSQKYQSLKFYSAIKVFLYKIHAVSWYSLAWVQRGDIKQ